MLGGDAVERLTVGSDKAQRALIEALDAGPVDLLGHSRGGHIAFRVAQQRPDLLRKISAYGGGGMLPITGMACAAASMKVKGLMKERHDINKGVREELLAV